MRNSPARAAENREGNAAGIRQGIAGSFPLTLGNVAQAPPILHTKKILPTQREQYLAYQSDMACEIEARRTGVYILSDDERAALEEARRSLVASEEEVAALWKRLGIG